MCLCRYDVVEGPDPVPVAGVYLRVGGEPAEFGPDGMEVGLIGVGPQGAQTPVAGGTQESLLLRLPTPPPDGAAWVEAYRFWATAG